MQLIRYGEEQSYPFRSQRLFSENGDWYFQTREGELVGPFHNRSEAKHGLAVFLAQTIYTVPSRLRAVNDEIVGVQDGVHDLVQELSSFFESKTSSGESAALAWANKRIAELRGAQPTGSEKARIDVLYYVMDQDHRFTAR
ncbi:DUF6316 family protein [Thiosocius teredinicola]|uniref:DUF6316 family protein n=1 Tax=Thiosocius teredinicola TaxID=1973002 RepID=UPI000990FCBA